MAAAEAPPARAVAGGRRRPSAQLACTLIGLGMSGAVGMFTDLRIGAAVAVAVVAVACLSLLDGWQRLYALTLTLLVGAASSLPGVASASFYPRYVLAGLLVLWTWREVPHGRPKLPTRARRLTGSLIVLVALALGSVAWSVNKAGTAQQAIALGLLVAFVTGLMHGRWRDGARVLADLRVAYALIAVIGAVSYGLGAVGYVQARGFNGVERVRLQGVFNNPNTLGFVTGLAIPLGVALLLRSTTRRVWYAIGLLPLVLCLLGSQSRTSLVGAAVGVAWIAVRRGATAWVKVLTVALVASVLAGGLGRLLGFSSPVDIQSVLDRFSSTSGGGVFNGRTVAWSDALHLWRHRPLEGYGFQAGEALFRQLNAAGVISFQAPVVHNSYLQMLLELGVLGAVPLVVLTLFVFLPVLVNVNPAAPAADLVGVAAAGLAVQITESAMFGTGQPYPWIFWPVIAALCVAERRSGDRQVGEARR